MSVESTRTSESTPGRHVTLYYPFPPCLLQVALLSGGTARTQGCGAALVSDRYVVTAAHCTAGRQASDLKVLVGDTQLAVLNETTSFIINVKTIKQHPDYNSSTTENDISVLELEETVDLTSHPHIKPICLPAQDTTYANRAATVAGWGTFSSGGSLASHLQEVQVTVFISMNSGVSKN